MKITRNLLIPLLLLPCLVCLISPVVIYAADYTSEIVSLYKGSDYPPTYFVLGSDIIGFNASQGFSSPIEYRVYREGTRYYDNFKLDYTLPDDGSQWKVCGTLFIAYRNYDDEGRYGSDPGLSIRSVSAYPVDFTVTTPGTFTGMSIGQAVNAATSAKNAANSAKSSADTASARVWDTAESKSAATLAKEARNKSNDALTKINSVETQISDIKNDISNIKSVVTNIQNSVSPHIQKISGRNGATCTRTSSFDVTIQASDAVEFRVKSDSGTWSNWASLDNYATATGLSSPGVYTIFIEAKSPSGATAMGQMMVFKL